MSVLGKIGSILAKVAPTVADLVIPGSGALAKIAKGAAGLAPVLGGAAKGQQSSQQMQAEINAKNDQTALERYKLKAAAPDLRRQAGVKASMVANSSPVQISRTPGRGGHTTVSGGFANPNLINPDTRAMADDMTHQALLTQMGHDSDIPQPTPMPGGGIMDKVLGGAALGTSALAAIQAAQRGVKPKPPVPLPGQQPPMMGDVGDYDPNEGMA